MEIFETAVNYVLYGAALFAGSMMFCTKRAWKEWFACRCAIFWCCYLAVMVILALISGLLDRPAWLESVSYSAAGVAVAVFFLLAFEERAEKLLYNVFAGSLCRYAGSKVVTVVLYFLPAMPDLADVFITYAVIFLSYVPIYFVFARKVARNVNFCPRAREILFLFALDIMVLPMALIEPYLSDSPVAYVYLAAVEVGISYGILMFQYTIYENAEHMSFALAEGEITRHRLEQYESFRGVMEVMNQKVHDMKHQIRDYAAVHAIDESVVRDLTESVTEYEAFVQTGNEPLDTVLTEKRIACLHRNIRMKLMVDGPAFSFLSVEDTNSLFGNLTENAVEYLSDLPEEERTLSVYSSRGGGFLKLTVENRYMGEGLDLDERGLPRTTKKDARLHGYGTRSVLRIAEKYGGNATFCAEDGLFKARVIFPDADARGESSEPPGGQG